MACKVAVVVLHYETLEDTRACIDSLIKGFHEDFLQVVVVDNGSPNGKLSTLESAYAAYSQITFLYSEQNLGFAKGNNIGYAYAKQHLDPQVIVLSNNDIVFKDADFADKLAALQAETGFDVAGPRITSLEDGKNQNPVGTMYSSKQQVAKRLLKYRILKFLCHLGLDVQAQKVLAKPVQEIAYEPGMDFQLHGACMFFAGGYLKQYDGLYDGTFMYGEECILKELVRQNNFHMAYLPELEVFHKEGSSTKKMWGKGKHQRLFYYKWSIHSFKQLHDMMP